MSTREKLLHILKDSPGEWVSGESIAQKLTLSRTSIWKGIKSLTENGYKIDSLPKRGYNLLSTPDLVTPDEIRYFIETSELGKKEIIYYQKIGSTNNVAKQLADEGYPNGTLVISEAQNKGRGRLGREWFSPGGKGIYLSIIMKPKLAPSQLPIITLMTALALSDAIDEYGQITTSIKWPNDILVNGKKIAGILTELITELDSISSVILGIGINVNLTKNKLPKELKDIVTSLMIEKSTHFQRAPLIASFLKKLEEYYDLLLKEGTIPIIDIFIEKSKIIGQKLKIKNFDNVYEGKVEKIELDGSLILKDSKKVLHRIFSGDVTIIKE